MRLKRGPFEPALVCGIALLFLWLGSTRAAEPTGLVGVWGLDLRPTPDADPCDQKMVIRKNAEGEMTGTFCGSTIRNLSLNGGSGDLRFAFVTGNGSVQLFSSGVLREGHIRGRTHSPDRQFLSMWTAERIPETPKGRLIDAVVRRYFDAGEFEGTILVAEAGEVIYERGYGLTNRDWGAPNGPDTRFLIASVTKQFTALLIMQMVGEGAIDLDAPILDYLPYYRKDTGRAITVRHLLQHTSGLPEGVVELDQYDDAAMLAGDRPEYVRRFWMGDPSFPPGTDFSYTNTDYGLLGVILEQVTGSSYDDLLQHRILDPLEMMDSGMAGYEKHVPGLATGYVKTEKGVEIRPYLGQPGYAAAGMYSTARDLFRWNRALLDHELLSPELTTTMFTPIIGINPTTGNYVAFGSWVYDRQLPGDRTIRLIERHGYISPFTALNVIAPDQGHSVIILCNVDPADIHGLPYAPGLPYDVLLTLVGLPAEGAQKGK